MILRKKKIIKFLIYGAGLHGDILLLTAVGCKMQELCCRHLSQFDRDRIKIYRQGKSNLHEYAGGS